MRVALLLLVTAVASGCATMHTFSLSGEDEIVLLDQRMAGHPATIVQRDGETGEGIVLFVRDDSTAWMEEQTRRAVPTQAIHRMTRHGNDRSVVKGVLIGTAVGAALGAAILLDGDQGFLDAESMAAATLGAGGFYGFVVSAIAFRPRTYLLRP